MGDLFADLGARLLRNRRFVRSPIWLYRHGAGWLLGQRILMLEHVGRSTGRPRYACLEVVEHPAPDTFVIVSGLGVRAQWYQNLQVQPECHVSIGGRRRLPARARIMSRAETIAALARYRSAHPRAWRYLSRTIERAAGQGLAGLPMVELRLREGRSTFQ